MSVTVTVGVSLTDWRPAYTGWLGVVDTRSQPVASRRLNAGWFTCGYSRRATRQTGLEAKPLVLTMQEVTH